MSVRMFTFTCVQRFTLPIQFTDMIDAHKIPLEVKKISEVLETAGFEAYLVGGCVRDLVVGKEPKDWDITTNAHPEQIIAIFPDLKTVNENDFGTVTVLNMPPETDAHVPRVTPDTDNIIQITTYRSEGAYSVGSYVKPPTFNFCC